MAETIDNKYVAGRLRWVADFLEGSDGTKTTVHIQLRTPLRPTAKDIAEGHMEQRENVTTLHLTT